MEHVILKKNIKNTMIFHTFIESCKHTAFMVKEYLTSVLQNRKDKKLCMNNATLTVKTECLLIIIVGISTTHT